MLSPASTRPCVPHRAYPGLADSPWATRCRSRVRGLVSPSARPRARGLALGYMLSPASTRPCVPHRAYPGLADSPWATRCRSRVRGLVYLIARTQGSRTRPVPRSNRIARLSILLLSFVPVANAPHEVGANAYTVSIHVSTVS